MSGKVEIRLVSKKVNTATDRNNDIAETLVPPSTTESSIVEVDGQDIIRLILQYLKENNLQRSFHTLQEESNVYLNAVENKEDILSRSSSGELGVLLQLSSEMDVPQSMLFNLFEHVALELLETGDKEALSQFLASSSVYETMARKEPLRFKRLETLKAKETRLTAEELWGEVPKTKRRRTLAKELLSQVPKVPSGRLLYLLKLAIQLQKDQGLIPGGSKYNLFEGITLSDRALCDMPATNIRHTLKLDTPGISVRSAIFSLEGNSIITGDSGGEILVWSWMTGKLRSDLKYQLEGFVMSHYLDDDKASPVTALALSADGKILASGDEIGTIKLWRIEEGKLLRAFTTIHRKAINSIDFHPTQPQILTASADGTAKITLLKSKGSVLKVFEGHGGFVINAIYEGKKAKNVVTSCSDGYFRVFKYDSGTLINKVTPPKPHSTLSIQGIEMMIRDPRNEHQLFICQRGPRIYCFTTKGDLVKIYDSQTQDDFIAIAASPQGEFIMGLTETGTHISFNCATGEQVSLISSRVKTPASYGLIYHHSQNIAALWGSDNELLILQG